MNLRPHRQDAPDINLTPLIDVVFLLLIFFMVSTTFKDDARLRLQLPEAEGEPVSADEIELVEVAIDRAGRFYVNDQLLVDRDPATLKQALIGAVGPARALPVLIKADADARHQAVMTVLDAAGQIGLTRIALAASHAESAGRGVDRQAQPGVAALSSPPQQEDGQRQERRPGDEEESMR